jgi:uncharacterized membrane protein
MSIDTAYISAIVVIVVGILNLFKVKVDSAEMTTFVTAVATVVLGLYIAYKKFKEGKITIVGTAKA